MLLSVREICAPVVWTCHGTESSTICMESGSLLPTVTVMGRDAVCDLFLKSLGVLGFQPCPIKHDFPPIYC